jgi:hypothetical protein
MKIHMWNVQIGVRMREIWLLQDLHTECTGLTGAPIPSQTCKRIFLRGKTSPPYKYKGSWPIKGYIIIESIKFIFYRIYLFFLLFQSTMLLSLHLRDVWRRHSWPAESRTNLRTPPRRDSARTVFVGLSPDLPGDTGLTSTAWRRFKELLRVLV